jgi:hypothetical protein
LKIDHLITQYLYQHKRVSLPGIGTFTLENGTPSFTHQSDAAISPELIEFVKSHTGKMTALATADIESYIMLHRQFLNIGKALHFEGIGTLVKAKEGLFDFTPAEMIIDFGEKVAEGKITSSYEEKPRYSSAESPGGSGRGILIFLGVAITLGIVVWGGWKWSQSGSGNGAVNQIATVSAPEPAAQATADSGKLVSDSISRRPTTDSSRTINTNGSVSVNPGRYKFIIETTNRRERAFRRYNQLVELRSGIRMETADSITYKLYFVLPANPTDTSRIKDSLRIFYASRIVTVEPAGN